MVFFFRLIRILGPSPRRAQDSQPFLHAQDTKKVILKQNIISKKKRYASARLKAADCSPALPRGQVELNSNGLGKISQKLINRTILIKKLVN